MSTRFLDQVHEARTRPGLSQVRATSMTTAEVHRRLKAARPGVATQFQSDWNVKTNDGFPSTQSQLLELLDAMLAPLDEAVQADIVAAQKWAVVSHVIPHAVKVLDRLRQMVTNLHRGSPLQAGSYG